MAGFFGSSTPSAKLPVKANTPPAKAPQRNGARPGHAGAGRQTFDAHEAERSIDVAAEVSDRGPSGDRPLEDHGTDSRRVLDSPPVKAERGLYRRPKKYGRQCRRTCPPRAPVVLPQRLSGNHLIATATTRPDRHGIPAGRIGDQTGLGPGSLVAIFHRVARLFARIPERLIQAYRLAPVQHADATGWRTNGHHG